MIRRTDSINYGNIVSYKDYISGGKKHYDLLPALYDVVTVQTESYLRKYSELSDSYINHIAGHQFPIDNVQYSWGDDDLEMVFILGSRDPLFPMGDLKFSIDMFLDWTIDHRLELKPDHVNPIGVNPLNVGVVYAPYIPMTLGTVGNANNLKSVAEKYIKNSIYGSTGPIAGTTMYECSMFN